jgi:putative two-component system response regulator
LSRPSAPSWETGMDETRHATILIADDDSETRYILERLLQQKGYATRTVADGGAVLQSVAELLPDLILLDGNMPGIDGFEVVKRLKSTPRTRTIPAIMITGMGDRESRLRALENGAEDFLVKPVDRNELWSRVRNHLRLKEFSDLLQDHNALLEAQVRERTMQLRESNREAILLLTSAAEYRDSDTGLHVRRISYLTSELARLMGMGAEFAELMFYASPMHDIGKIGVPDSVLLKPGPLDAMEWEVMKSHTVLGKHILESGTTEYMKIGARIAFTHHERWDGTGYPSGARGDDVPLCGYIMGICDQYDALRSKRPYKAPFDHGRVVEIISRGDGRTHPGHFHPEVLAAFESHASKFEEVFASVA